MNSVSCSLFEVRFQCFHSVTASEWLFIHSPREVNVLLLHTFAPTYEWCVMVQEQRKQRKMNDEEINQNQQSTRQCSDKCVLSCFRSFLSLCHPFALSYANVHSLIVVLFLLHFSLHFSKYDHPMQCVLLEYSGGLSHENENIINNWHVR